MEKSLDKILSEEPIFFTKDFPDDLSRLAHLTESNISAIKEWLSSLEDYSSLSSAEAWIEVSRALVLPIEDLQQALRPIGLIARLCVKHDVGTNNLIEHLEQRGIFAGDDDISKVRELLQLLTPPMVVLLKVADEAIGPDLPLLYIKSAKTQCIIVSEYKVDIDFKADDPQKYKPRIKKLHTRTTLELDFVDSNKEPVGILLTPESLRDLRNTLEAAEIEMAVTDKYINK